MSGEDARGEHVRRTAERRGHADGLAAQVFHRLDVRVGPGLDAEATRVDAAGDLHVQVAIDRPEQVHEQRMVGVETAGAEARLQAVPVRLDQLDVQAFLLEEALLLGGENRGLARQANVGDLELDRPGLAVFVWGRPTPQGEQDDADGPGQRRDRERDKADVRGWSWTLSESPCPK